MPLGLGMASAYRYLYKWGDFPETVIKILFYYKSGPDFVFRAVDPICR